MVSGLVCEQDELISRSEEASWEESRSKDKSRDAKRWDNVFAFWEANQGSFCGIRGSR